MICVRRAYKTIFRRRGHFLIKGEYCKEVFYEFLLTVEAVFSQLENKRSDNKNDEIVVAIPRILFNIKFF